MILYENYGKTQKQCLQFYILSSKYFLPLLSLAEFLPNLNQMCFFGRFLYIFGRFLYIFDFYWIYWIHLYFRRKPLQKWYSTRITAKHKSDVCSSIFSLLNIFYRFWVWPNFYKILIKCVFLDVFCIFLYIFGYFL